MKLPLAALAALVTILPAAARDNGQWGDQPANIREWFQSLMQPDAGNPTGHGIVFIGPQGQVYCYVAPGGV